MKKTNIFAAATAMVMALASLPVVSASADSTFAPGDVDMDGVITGHDSAVVSRSLYEEDASLTAEQIALADVNGDGVVDQTDLEWIHGQEEYVIGDTCMAQKAHIGVFDAYAILWIDSWHNIGIQFVSDASVEPFANHLEMNSVCAAAVKGHIQTVAINPVQYNLMDVDGNGTVDITDAYNTLYAHARMCISMPSLAESGRYDLPAANFYENFLR